MCLGVPGKIADIYMEDNVRMGKIDFGGIRRSACLEHVSHAVLGDYVLVHVGYALSKIDEEEAKRIFELLEELKQLDELNVQSPESEL